ncbi:MULTISPECIES: hypothetical protein [Vitreoscilla]|uniref:Uncharacterized protein n=1 Tax=Vitreoscilla stercoraria TaxID=61 RepID=A0ABY4EEM2_VITST|nr:MULTISPECIES: hypothetical protein [Vitreoscilla]AUZ04407.1 hypothetical protein ADP71_06350 [Vitreoscilla sp. C1]UOO91872.1 hypothetical protein LVJ81_09535 [Vitreoscilla stercoraria]
MNTYCNIAALNCDIVFKTIEHSHVVGVWWVNPVQCSQILHLGQYHVQEDAWCDGLSGGIHGLSDEACLKLRPAVRLNVSDLIEIRAQAQVLFGQRKAMAA